MAAMPPVPLVQYVVASVRASLPKPAAPCVAIRLRLLSVGNSTTVTSSMAVGDAGTMAIAEDLGAALGGGEKRGGSGTDCATSFLLAAISSYGQLRRSLEAHSAAGKRPTQQQQRVGPPLSIDLQHIGGRLPPCKPDDITSWLGKGNGSVGHAAHAFWLRSAAEVTAGRDPNRSPGGGDTDVAELAAADVGHLDETATAPAGADQRMKPLRESSPLSTVPKRHYYDRKEGCAMEANEDALCRALDDGSRCAFARAVTDSGALQAITPEDSLPARKAEAHEGDGLLTRVLELHEHLRGLTVQSAHWLGAQLLLRTEAEGRHPVWDAFSVAAQARLASLPLRGSRARLCLVSDNQQTDNQWTEPDAIGMRRVLLQRLLLTTGPSTVAQLVGLARAAETQQRAAPRPLLPLAISLMAGYAPGRGCISPELVSILMPSWSMRALVSVASQTPTQLDVADAVGT